MYIAARTIFLVFAFSITFQRPDSGHFTRQVPGQALSGFYLLAREGRAVVDLKSTSIDTSRRVFSSVPKIMSYLDIEGLHSFLMK
jgi:hypothetical protein